MIDEKICDTDKCLALNMAKQNKSDIEKIKEDMELNQKDSISDKITLAVIEKTVKTLETNFIKINAKLDNVLEKPAKRQEGAIGTLIGAVIGGLVTIALASVFRGGL